MASGTKNKPFKIVCDAFHNVLLTVIIASGAKAKSPLRVMFHVIRVYAIMISKSRQETRPRTLAPMLARYNAWSFELKTTCSRTYPVLAQSDLPFWVTVPLRALPSRVR
jgi:hypothetical protein